jgi:hypothetical protein
MSKEQFVVGRGFRFRNQRIWPEGGMICIENQLDGDFKVLTRQEAAARAIALNRELPYIDYPDERVELSNCVCNLCEAIKEAKRQGDPDDPNVRRDRIRSMQKVSMITGDVKLIKSSSITMGSISSRFSQIQV